MSWLKEKIELVTEMLDKNEKEKEYLTEMLHGYQSQTEVACEKCDSVHQISDLTYIQTHWYEDPYGCTGGDRWHSGEGQWGCICGFRNRLYNKPEITALKYRFGNIKEEYND